MKLKYKYGRCEWCGRLVRLYSIDKCKSGNEIFWYECPNCHDFIFVGHTCKSRLCTSCGYKYKLIRVENILEHAYNCSHRQIVFTIAEELRPFLEKFDQTIINRLVSGEIVDVKISLKEKVNAK